MAEFTAQEQQQLKAIVAEASQPGAALSVAPAGAARAPALPGDIRDIFCKNWETVKKVLLFIRNFPGVPKKIKDAIDAIIRIGDGAHRVICG